jgi:DNA polymerase
MLKEVLLELLNTEADQCFKCGLHEEGEGIVFGVGPADADIMLIGEAPGLNEQIDGMPFIGRAGKLLDDILTIGMGIKRDDVYLANILKCRPPENRDPSPEESRLCTPWLTQQIDTVNPKLIITIGKYASQFILGLDYTMGQMRGKVYERNGRFVVPTWHTAYALRNPAIKPDIQYDMNLALEAIGYPIVQPI